MRSQAQRGFSLLEVMVSMIIMMLVVLIAVQMLQEAGRLLVSAQVELSQSSDELATQWLRRDVQGASQLGTLAFSRTREPLELRGNREGTLRYEKVGNRLDRVILAATGEEIGRRTVLRGVVSWRWRALSPAVVEVDLIYQRRVFLGATGAGPPVRDKTMAERRWLALRGLPRRSW